VFDTTLFLYLPKGKGNAQCALGFLRVKPLKNTVIVWKRSVHTMARVPLHGLNLYLYSILRFYYTNYKLYDGMLFYLHKGVVMAKEKFPSLEEISAKKEDLLQVSKVLLEKEKGGRGSPKSDFLSSLSGEIKMLLEQGMTYVGLRKAIKEVYGVNVSTQILSNYAKRELGISSRKRGKKTSVSETLSSGISVPKKMENSDGIKHEKEGF